MDREASKVSQRRCQGKRIQSWCCAIGYCLFAILNAFITTVNADIATDGTVGPATSLTGPNFEIGASLGTTKGANLFHSFQTFNIDAGESATFTGPDGTANVISRVTGGEFSSIDGALRSEVGTADFYFINPAGVIFGPNAQIEVPAAFHVSTADELRFHDGAVFSATKPTASTLTIAEPESFGFLSAQPASISLHGSNLIFNPERRVSMSAGDLILDSGTVVGTSGGEIHLTAVGESGGAVDVATGIADETPSGTVALSGSSIGVNGFQGGETVALRGGEIAITNSMISAHHHGSADGAGRILLEGGQLQVLNSDIRAWTAGEGRGNDIELIAQQLVIDATTAANGSSRVSTGAYLGVTGSAGDVRTEADSIRLTNGGKLSSDYYGATGQGGAVIVNAESLYIDDGGIPGRTTGIETLTALRSTGDAGSIIVEVGGFLEMVDGGVINSRTSCEGSAGDIVVRAGTLRIDGGNDGGGWGRYTGVLTEASDLSTGNPGSVHVEVGGLLEMVDGGVITSDTLAVGTAGDIVVRAACLSMDGGGELFTKISSDAQILSAGDAGSVLVEVDSTIMLHDGAKISAEANNSGTAGRVEVRARDLHIDGNSETGISTVAHVGAQSSAGDIIVRVDDLLELHDQANISSSSFGTDAGTVTIHAGRLSMVGSGSPDGSYTFIGSQAESGSSGMAGIVDLQVDGCLELANGAWISASSAGIGSASSLGSVNIHAAELDMDGGDAFAIIGASSSFSAGNAGSVVISVDGAMNLRSSAGISAASSTEGEGGTVVVQADSLRLDGGATWAEIASDASGSGDGGSVQLTVEGLLELVHGGKISTSTKAEGNAGDINIEAGEIHMANQGSEWGTGLSAAAVRDSTGNGGDIKVHADRSLKIIDGAQILTSTFATGDAGGIDIETGSLYVEGADTGNLYTGIFSSVEPGASGNGGPTRVVAHGKVELRGGGSLSNATSGQGDADQIIVRADELFIDGIGILNPTEISSEAFPNASGEVGIVDIQAHRLVMSNGGEISIASGQTLPVRAQGRRPAALATDLTGYIHVQANDLLLDSGARITAESTGDVPASAIEIKADDMVLSGGGQITTESKAADGGPITIGGGILQVSDSLITTSVEGERGNGGDITLSPDLLVLDGGFIQANTTAPLASGGDILIETKALVASGGEVQVGGAERAVFQAGRGFNVIQAAAPGGEQGIITITAPELDISGTLANLATGFFEPDQLIGDPCVALTGEMPSSLVQGARGGIPTGPKGPASVSFGGERLDRLLSAPLAPAGKRDRSITHPSDEEPSTASDQVERCRLRVAL